MKNDKLVKLDTTCNETGFVIKKYENSPKVGAYIPSLMSDIDMKKGPWEQKVATIKGSVLKNDNNSFRFDPITICNYYDVDQRDNSVYYVDKELGEKIRIKYEDNDIKKAFFFDEDYKMTDSLMEEVEEIKEILEVYREELNTINKDLNSKEEKISNLIEEDIDLQSQLNIKDNEIARLQSQIANLQSVDANLQSEINVKSSQIANLQSQINNLEQEINSKNDLIDSLNLEISNLQGQIVYVLELVRTLGGE